MSTSTIFSASTRKRGRGTSAVARKASRAAFKAWDTRRTNIRSEKRAAAAKKAMATRRRNARLST